MKADGEIAPAIWHFPLSLSLMGSCFYFLPYPHRNSRFHLRFFFVKMSTNVFLCHCFSWFFQNHRHKQEERQKKRRRQTAAAGATRHRERRSPRAYHTSPCLTRTLCQRVVKSYKRGGFEYNKRGVVNFSSSTFFFLWFRTTRGSQQKAFRLQRGSSAGEFLLSHGPNRTIRQSQQVGYIWRHWNRVIFFLSLSLLFGVSTAAFCQVPIITTVARWLSMI